MNILGIIAFQGHSSSVCLLKDGETITAVSEERFSRIKDDTTFPLKSLNYIFKNYNIEKEDIDLVTFGWNPNLNILKHLTNILKYFPHSYNYLFEKRHENGKMSRFHKFIKTNAFKNNIRKYLGHKVEVNYCEHHLSHSYSSFFQSGFDGAISLVADGCGEYTTTSIYSVDRGIHKLIYRDYVPHSLGYLYSAITQLLGFQPDSDEFKVMGLSAYGRPKYLKEFSNIINWKNDKIIVNEKYFLINSSGNKFYSQKLLNLLDGNNLNFQNKADIAKSLQLTLQNILLNLLKHIKAQYPTHKNLCTSGGVFLNCTLNQCIRDSNIYDNYFFSPISSDLGTSIGSAQMKYFQETKLIPSKLDSLFLGTQFSREDIVYTLKKHNLIPIKCENFNDFIAKLLAEKNIIGWFQGSSEFGPRALGNRSILSDPRDINMKEKINKKVKFREYFRPFAPSILNEEIENYFKCTTKARSFPYMIETLDCNEDRRKTIPAVVHVDGTSRIQTVTSSQNVKLYNLLKSFFKITNVPLLLNTSFNINREPIVDSPDDAIRTASIALLDYVVIGDFIIKIS